MITNAELAAELLRSAARFLRLFAEEANGTAAPLYANADTFEAVADNLEIDPQAEAIGQSQTQLSSF